MKVLFCSPYSDSPDVVKGGINTWGRYVLAYHKYCANDDVELVPVSFDRFTDVKEGQSFLSRAFYGSKEYMRAMKTAIAQMKTEKPDVMHICTCAGIGLVRDYLLLRAAKKRGIKTVVHLHFGRVPELVVSKGWEWKLLAKNLRTCDVAVVMNKPTEKALMAEQFKNVEYLPNPLGMDVWNDIQESVGKYCRVPRRLLFCGNVIPTKGVMELVEACCRVPNIQLRIVGKCDADVKEKMLAVAKKEAEDVSWITFVGEVAHKNVIREFLQADMFVFPSYTEGFPNVILEAMACGCPVVSSNVGAIPEMLNVESDACGICFKAHSADEVYNAIVKLLEDDKQKQIFAAKAKARVDNMYTMPVVWKRLVEIWTL